MPLTQYRAGRLDGPSDVFVATPSGSGRPCSNYTVSLAETFAKLTEQGIAADYYLHSWDCHVDDSRNTMVKLFLESKCPVMVFIDDDVGWQAKDFIRLMQAAGDIVCGVYPLKQDNEDYPVRTLEGELRARADGLLEVSGAPTGFMAIKRHVLEAMAEKRKWTRFKTRGSLPGDPMTTIIFERTLAEGNRWSGDLNFCREARQLGFKIWIDPEMTFSHEGSKQWRGCLGNWLRRTQGILDPKLDEAFRRLQSGEATKDVFQQIFARAFNPYAAGPAMLEYVYNRALHAKGPVLETGSGLTSVVMGLACLRNGNTVWSLEHDLGFFRETRKLIERYKLQPNRLCYTPLHEYERGSAWYEIPDGLPETFDFALCDGPPRTIGDRGKLFDLLGGRIAEAEWVIDDVDDRKQIAHVEKYAEPAGRAVEVVGTAPGRQFAVVRTA